MVAVLSSNLKPGLTTVVWMPKGAISGASDSIQPSTANFDAAGSVVAALRGTAGRNPYDRAMSDLIGVLSMRSEEFRARWASHDVRFHRSGTKRLQHPLVGDLTLAYESLELPADPSLTLVTYSAEPGSPSEAALVELARWSTTRAKLSAVEAATQV
jgi:hypothetical protein